MSHKPVPFDIPCVIFAGGKSSRMGRDKALLPFGGYNSLAEFQYRRLSSLFEKVYISAKENKFNFTADIIEDSPGEKVFAPTAGFNAMFKKLKDERIFVLSVDTPFVGEEEIRTLLENDSEELDAVIAKTGSGTHPMCGIYHRSLLPSFEQMLQEDNHRLGQLLKKSKTVYIDFKDETPFANLNHPHEYEEAFKSL
ncbi:molybdenum cofactor guanylyltransferase MobA [Sulfurimonas sp. HSL3-7]|uniref:molybdenum cofactor guanylyltransferase MobA n=1 Tax=Sulfonitrofixus jiaomeiensis TaxID=3131938 RepID=UPI0031F7A5CE